MQIIKREMYNFNPIHGILFGIKNIIQAKLFVNVILRIFLEIYSLESLIKFFLFKKTFIKLNDSGKK